MSISVCLNKVGRNFRTLIFELTLNLCNLYELMNMVSWYTERQGSNNTSVAGVGINIRRLKFTFHSKMAKIEDQYCIRRFSPEEKLLDALKRLI